MNFNDTQFYLAIKINVLILYGSGEVAALGTVGRIHSSVSSIAWSMDFGLKPKAE